MKTVNEVILLWWVANKPLLKETKNNQKLSVFNLVTKRVWTTKDWEKKEESQFHKIVCWGKLWEKTIDLLGVWDLIHIRWYLHNRKVEFEWEQKPRLITEIIVNDLIMVKRKKNESSNDQSK